MNDNDSDGIRETSPRGDLSWDTIETQGGLEEHESIYSKDPINPIEITELQQIGNKYKLNMFMLGDSSDQCFAAKNAKRQLRIIDWGENNGWTKFTHGWTIGCFEWDKHNDDDLGYEYFDEDEAPEEFHSDLTDIEIWIFPDDSCWTFISSQTVYICSHYSLSPAPYQCQEAVKRRDALKDAFKVLPKDCAIDEKSDGYDHIIYDDKTGKEIYRGTNLI